MITLYLVQAEASRLGGQRRHLAHAYLCSSYERSVRRCPQGREVIEPALAHEAAQHGTEAEFDEDEPSIEHVRFAPNQDAFRRETDLSREESSPA